MAFIGLGRNTFRFRVGNPGSWGYQTDQSSTLRPGTRRKSRWLRVTTTAAFSKAMDAIRRSMRRTFSRRALSCATRAIADSV
jgi:hypothetical protein